MYADGLDVTVLYAHLEKNKILNGPLSVMCFDHEVCTKRGADLGDPSHLD